MGFKAGGKGMTVDLPHTQDPRDSRMWSQKPIANVMAELSMEPKARPRILERQHTLPRADHFCALY